MAVHRVHRDIRPHLPSLARNLRVVTAGFQSHGRTADIGRHLRHEPVGDVTAAMMGQAAPNARSPAFPVHFRLPIVQSNHATRDKAWACIGEPRALSLLATTDDAEQFAKAWLQKKYGKKLGKVKFVEVMSDNGVWTVKANAKLAVGVLLIKPHIIQIKIDAGTAEVLGYSEAEAMAKEG